MRAVTATCNIEAPSTRVLEQFVDVEAMRRWWSVDRGLVEPRAGGLWALAWEVSPQGFRYVTTGTIDVYEPGRRLEIVDLVYFNPKRSVLGPMQLFVMVQPSEEGTRITVRQDGYQYGEDWDWYHEAATEAWLATLELLKQYLEDTEV